MSGIQGMGRPSSIASPVPNDKIDLGNVAKVPDIASMQMPEAAPATQAAAQPSLDDIFGASSSPSQPSLDDIFGSAPDQALSEASSEELAQASKPEMKMNERTGMLFPKYTATDDPGAKIDESFAKSPSEKKFALERAYGKGNVKKAGEDGYLVKKEGKWHGSHSSNWRRRSSSWCCWNSSG